MWRYIGRQFSQQQQQRYRRLLPASAISTPHLQTNAFSSTSSSNNASSLSHERGMLLAGVAGAIVSGTIYFVTKKKSSSTTTIAITTEEESRKLETTNDESSTVHDSHTIPNITSDNNEQKEEEDDPYANLPEEDEETDCSMCQTFRKGPCRPYWRKLERCLKDHEQSDNVGAACLKYFTPHSTCLLQYTNLYHLVSLHLKQELVNDAELAVRQHERRCWIDSTSGEDKSIGIDWKPWMEFYQHLGPSFQQTIPQPPPPAELDANTKIEPIPLWQRLPENTEPILVTTKAHVPSMQEDMILKIAYAVDQDGMVLGLSYNKSYGDLVEQIRDQQKNKNTEESGNSATNESGANKENNNQANSSAVPSESTKQESSSANAAPGLESTTMAAADDNANTTDKGNDNTYEMEFHIFPGETKSVLLCAMYSENPALAPPEKRILDILLYKSRMYDLTQIGERANNAPSDSNVQ